MLYFSFAVSCRFYGAFFHCEAKGGSVLQRPTQTAAFWRDQFEVNADDVEFLYQFLLDAQKPQKLSEVALRLIDEYLRRENARIEQELTKGAGYAP